MAASEKTLNRIDKTMAQISQALSGVEPEYNESSELATSIVPNALQNFDDALLDDLSMPRAAASLFNVVKGAEKELKAHAKDSNYNLDIFGLKVAQNALLQMDQIFGIFYEVPLTLEQLNEVDENKGHEIPGEVLELVSRRTQAKEAKDWELADSLRARIAELGFTVKDVKDGEPEISRIS